MIFSRLHHLLCSSFPWVCSSSLLQVDPSLCILSSLVYIPILLFCHPSMKQWDERERGDVDAQRLIYSHFVLLFPFLLKTYLPDDEVTKTLILDSFPSIAPVAPDKTSFITINSSYIMLHLSSWKSTSCPINNFIIQYKQQGSNEWTLVSNSITPVLDHFLLPDLSSGTWYNLLIGAHSDAGSTEAEYMFATLTEGGATISPLSISSLAESPEGRMRRYLQMFLPIVSIFVAFIVILVLLLVLSFRRNSHQSNIPGLSPHSSEYLRHLYSIFSCLHLIYPLVSISFLLVYQFLSFLSLSFLSITCHFFCFNSTGILLLSCFFFLPLIPSPLFLYWYFLILMHFGRIFFFLSFCLYRCPLPVTRNRRALRLFFFTHFSDRCLNWGSSRHGWPFFCPSLPRVSLSFLSDSKFTTRQTVLLFFLPIPFVS